MDPQVIMLALAKWGFISHDETVNTGETSWLFKNELGFKEMTHAYVRGDYMMKPSQTRCKPGHMLPCSAGWDLLCHAAWQRSRKLETKKKQRKKTDGEKIHRTNTMSHDYRSETTATRVCVCLVCVRIGMIWKKRNQEAVWLQWS